MKITRRKFLQLIESSIRKNLLKEEEQKKEGLTKEWQNYVNVASSEDDRKKRLKIAILWTSLTTGQQGIEAAEKDIPVNPAEEEAGYSGWKSWYKKVVANKEMMSKIGRTVGTYFSVDDFFKLVNIYEINYDEQSIKTNLEQNKEVVDDFMAGINFGSATRNSLSGLSAVSSSVKADKTQQRIKRFKSVAQKFDTDPDNIDYNKLNSDIEDLKKEGAYKIFEVVHAITKFFNNEEKASEFFDAIDLKVPTRSEVENSEEYKSGKSAVDKSFLGKLDIFSKTSGGKKEANESYRRTKKLTRAQIRNIVESTFFR